MSELASVNFTKANLAKIKCPRGKWRHFVYDTKIKGLMFAVTPSGHHSFYFRRKFKGQAKRIKLGDYPIMSVEQARKKAQHYHELMNEEVDPAEQMGRTRSGMTIANLWETYLEDYAKVEKRTWDNDLYRYQTHIKPWASRKLLTIERPEVERWHRKIKQYRGLYAANRALALLKTMFNYARQIGYKGANPASGIKMFPEIERERFLEPDEMKRFLKALMGHPNEKVRAVFFTALLTGARIGNVYAMRWDEIDHHTGIWVVPAEKSKSKRPLRIPLMPEVIDLLNERKASSKSDFVFPGRVDGHVGNLRTSFINICKEAEIRGLHIHDLRRSLGSWQAASGASLLIIGKTLGHTNQQTTQIYARLNLDPVRQSMMTATGSMLTAAGLGRHELKSEVGE